MKKVFDKIQRETDMPPISLMDMPFIEITGNNHIEIDGIRKIIETNQNAVKIKFKDYCIGFMGENLNIRNFSGKSAIIEGEISAISFES